MTRGGRSRIADPLGRYTISVTRVWSGIAGFLLLASGAAMATDEPRYTVVRSEEKFEVRRYEPYLVAETLVARSADEAGSQGFRMLAGYIFGKNKGAREIAMTALSPPTSHRVGSASGRWPGCLTNHASCASDRLAAALVRSAVDLPTRNLPALRVVSAAS